MNRNIGIRTLSDEGGLIGADSKDCNTRSPGTHDLYVVPPVFSVHAESSQVQGIFVLDDDNTIQKQSTTYQSTRVSTTSSQSSAESIAVSVVRYFNLGNTKQLMQH